MTITFFMSYNETTIVKTSGTKNLTGHLEFSKKRCTLPLMKRYIFAFRSKVDREMDCLESCGLDVVER